MWPTEILLETVQEMAAIKQAQDLTANWVIRNKPAEPPSAPDHLQSELFLKSTTSVFLDNILMV